jgi:hypothetical protein
MTVTYKVPHNKHGFLANEVGKDLLKRAGTGRKHRLKMKGGRS